MRFLTVSHFYESHGGGIEMVAGSLSRALARRGHDVTWAAAALDPEPSDGLLSLVPLRAIDPIEGITGLPMPLLSPAALVRLDKAVAEADAIIVHDALYVSSLAAARAARRHKKPWIIIQHIGDIPYPKRHLRFALTAANRFVTRPMLARATQAIFISELVRRHFADVPFRKPPTLMFNGVDAISLSPAMPDERAALRETLALATCQDAYLFVGRFVEKKGVQIIRALAASRPQSLFLMAGSGPCDPSLWGLPNVRSLGRCTREQLAKLYKASDALLLPSSGEGYPLVVQEAMAAGLPIFCGLDSAQADPQASAYLHGVAVDLSDPYGTAERFNDALTNARTGVNWDAAAYARAAYDWDRNAETIERLLMN